MFERLTDKASQPTRVQIESYLGDDSWRRLQAFEQWLRAHYELSTDIRFPFGPSYGWGYKYSHKTAHLCYVFFEAGAFTVTIQIGDKQVPSLLAVIEGLSPKAQDLWTHRYPCGDQGGWVHYQVTTDQDLDDVCNFVTAKKKPAIQPPGN
ncbi:MAG: DUF3788 domain-containing protein [Propionibacteriaceae bacterium]|nr:DUF3788 domain-containing protein [Propionibacteriaceae bacterium]